METNEKLEMNHLKGYFDTDTKFILSEIGLFNIDSELEKPKEAYDVLKLTNILFSDRVEVELQHDNGWSIGLIELEEIKPILHHLSSITKEQLEEFSICFRMWYDKPNFDYKLMIYSDIELCFKHHLDIFGWIEKGLAIDASTLTDSPY